jgi:ribonucleoside-triphosphate reductase
MGDIETLLTTLGIISNITVTDRTDEPVVIRGESFNRNYPLYCIRFYDKGIKRSQSNLFKTKNNSVYFKIRSVEALKEIPDYTYCFEMKNTDEPYFTLPNGIITHNCRLRNELADNTFSYTLGAGGVVTGSSQVITINLNRVIQSNVTIPTIHKRVQKYLLAHKALYKEYIDAGMLPSYTAGFMDIDKQFLTVGINGLTEAAEFLGYTVGNNPEYKQWVAKLLAGFTKRNKAGLAEYGTRFNTEQVPAENLGVKNAKWDTKDGLMVPRSCYNSYFYIVEDDSSTLLDKIALHGNEITQYLDGGSALHLNLQQLMSQEQAKTLFDICRKQGVPYFTFNVKCTICNSCGTIDPQTRNSCNHCGSSNVDYGTRVIGYLKRISNFSAARQNESERRFYM